MRLRGCPLQRLPYRGKPSEAAVRGNITQNIHCAKVPELKTGAFTKAQTLQAGVC